MITALLVAHYDQHPAFAFRSREEMRRDVDVLSAQLTGGADEDFGASPSFLSQGCEQRLLVQGVYNSVNPLEEGGTFSSTK